MNKLDLIKYDNVPLGTTITDTCPQCEGGRTRERSFRVSRTPTGYAYICHRASCGFTGFREAASHTMLRPGPSPSKVAASAVFRIPTRRIDEVEAYWLGAMFGIKLDISRHVKVAEDGRFVFTIRGWDGEVRGYTVRTPRWKNADWIGDDSDFDFSLPKSMCFLESPDMVKAAWYLPDRINPVGHGDKLVIVEDQLSAMRLAGMGVPAMALCGAYIGEAHVQDILRYAYKHPNLNRIIIALDPDALGKACQQAARWQQALPADVFVAMLSADPKDYASVDELRKDLQLLENT